MKIVFVVDSITELNNKINLFKNRFGDNISFVVRADLVELFKTYGFTPNAIYYNNLTKIIETFLINEFQNDVEDVIIYYSSLKINDILLTKFISSIGNKTKFVNLTPKYNMFERMCNSAYNVYVKSMFKLEDSLSSPKLQFIPSDFMFDLLSSHLGNRLFKYEETFVKEIHVEDEEITKSMKVKINPLKNWLLCAIIALVITIGLIATIAYFKVNFILIFVFSILYILDFILTLMFLCKAKFDKRFLK